MVSASFLILQHSVAAAAVTALHIVLSCLANCSIITALTHKGTPRRDRKSLPPRRRGGGGARGGGGCVLKHPVYVRPWSAPCHVKSLPGDMMLLLLLLLCRRCWTLG